MANYTENYNLKKPGRTDFYSVQDFNDNADIIDTALNNKLNKDFSNISSGAGGAVPIANGGTGATTAATALSNLGAVSLTGGTMTGRLEIEYDHQEEASFTVTNPNGSIQLSVNNNRGIYDVENSKWVLKSTPGSSDWSFNGTMINNQTINLVYTQSSTPSSAANGSLWAW